MVLEQFIIDADIIWDQVGKTFFENPEAKPGRIMRVQVVNAGIVEDLTGYTLNLGWTSVRDPSKFGLDAFDDVDITKGIFEIEYTSGMLTNVGPLNASLQLVPPGEGRPIESNNFKLTVKNSAINPAAIQGETSFSTLENALVEVNGWNARIDLVEQEFKDRAEALDGAYPVRLTSVENSVLQKAEKSTTADMQTQINNLVLGAVGDGNNAEVVQARGTSAVLNDRLNKNDAMLASIKQNKPINLADDILFEPYNANVSNVQKNGNAVYFDTISGETGIKLNYQLKLGREYVLIYKHNDANNYFFSPRLFKTVWGEQYPSGNERVFEIKPSIDNQILVLHGQAPPSAAFSISVYLYDVTSNSVLKESLFKNYSNPRQSAFRLSDFENESNLLSLDTNNYVYRGSVLKTFQSTSNYFTITGTPLLKVNARYFFVLHIKNARGTVNIPTTARVRSIYSNSWDNNVNTLLSTVSTEDNQYLSGVMSPTIYDVANAQLALDLAGLTLETEYIFDIYIFQINTDTQLAALSQPDAFLSPSILSVTPLSTFKNDMNLLDFDKIVPLGINTITRAPGLGTYFPTNITVDLKVAKKYYIAVQLLESLNITGLSVRTLTSGSWDNIVNQALTKQSVGETVYYDGFFTSVSDATRNLYLNTGGMSTVDEFIYKVYVFDATDPVIENVFKVQNAFLNPSLLSGGRSSYNVLSGKKMSALGDSLTAAGYFLTYIKNQLGLAEIKNCGIGGTRVSGTGAECFWQDVRINSLNIDSDYILIMGGTNDAPYTTVVDADFSRFNFNTDNFVGAYNVLLSKIYYRYMNLDAGFYPGIGYTGVAKASTPKDIKIFLITPPKTIDSNEDYRFLFSEYVRRIGKMWGLPVIDANSEMQMNDFNYPLSATDKVHFPLNFHINLAKLIVGKIKAI